MHELVSGLKRLGVSLSAREVRGLLSLAADAADDETLTRHRFAQVFQLNVWQPDTLAALRALHDALYLSRRTVRQLFAEADTDRDGRVGVLELGLALQQAAQKQVQAVDAAHRDEAASLAALGGSSLDAAACLQRICDAQGGAGGAGGGGGERVDQRSRGSSRQASLTYEEVVRLLAYPPRPVDWEQDVIQRAQAYIVKGGRSAEQTFQNLVGAKRELSKVAVGRWLMCC